jgi:serine/threonine protein kinase
MPEVLTPPAAAALLGLPQPPASSAELENAWAQSVQSLQRQFPPDNLATQASYQTEFARLSSARAVLQASLSASAHPASAASMPRPTAGMSMISPGYTPSMVADMASLSPRSPAPAPGRPAPSVPATMPTPFAGAAGAMPSLRPGSLLSGRYEIVSQLGAGGMGVVYTAIDRLKRNEEIAIKVLSPSLTANTAAKERFLNEAIIATSLNHPGIVKVHTPEQQGDLIFLTMEKLQGRSLRAVLEECRERKVQLKLSEILRIAAALCDALNYAHTLPQPVIHRDIKPENIFICRDGSVRLMDFGLAQKAANTAQLTAVATAMGTVDYMAPEQKTDARNADHRADQYALAVTLYEMIAGRVPQGKFPPPKEVRKGIPAPLSDAIMRALNNSPAKRFPTTAAFRDKLREKEQWTNRLFAPDNRDMLATAGCVVLLLAGGVWFALQRTQAKPATPPPSSTRSTATGNSTAPKTTTRPADARPEPKATGGLSVTTTPPGAEVTLGGQYAGTSPARFTNVPAGRYTMRIVLKDYAEVSEEVEIKAGDFTNRIVQLELKYKLDDPKQFFEETIRIMQQAEGYQNAQARSQALQKWREAETRLKILSQRQRTWQPLAVAQRLRECEAAIKKLQ